MCSAGFIKTHLERKASSSGNVFITPVSPLKIMPQATNVLQQDAFAKGNMGEHATTPADFARGFVKMALSSSPPKHYVAGHKAWLAAFIGNWAPNWLLDLIMRDMYKIPRRISAQKAD